MGLLKSKFKNPTAYILEILRSKSVFNKGWMVSNSKSIKASGGGGIKVASDKLAPGAPNQFCVFLNSPDVLRIVYIISQLFLT